MASWSGLLAMTGFHYSGVTKEITFANISGNYFWSNGYAYGMAEISEKEGLKLVNLKVINGKLEVAKVAVEGLGKSSLKAVQVINSGDSHTFSLKV